VRWLRIIAARGFKGTSGWTQVPPAVARIPIAKNELETPPPDSSFNGFPLPLRTSLRSRP